MRRKDPEYVLRWHFIVEDFLKSDISAPAYAKEKNISRQKLSTMVALLSYRKHTDLRKYEKFCGLAKKYKISGMTQDEFCSKNSITVNQLKPALAHLKCLKILNKALEDNKDNLMNFINVSKPEKTIATIQQQEQPSIQEEHEVIKKKNDIEITISQGVRVTLSPNIESTKIIKIIDLLKDL